jgi:heterotetrameric sarcosine oxidase gamma subunit
VAEFEPIARSPIEPLPPVVVAEGWQVSDRRSAAALRIVDCTPLAKVMVRADPQAGLARSLGVGFGRAARDSDDALVIGSTPGEWLLLGPPGSAPALAARVRGLASGEFNCVIDRSHARALMRITGADAAALLAKVCGIDLDDRTTPDGSVVRTSVAKVVAEIVRDDSTGVASYLIHCEWSAGQYLFDALCDAGAEFGIEIDGFAAAIARVATRPEPGPGS